MSAENETKSDRISQKAILIAFIGIAVITLTGCVSPPIALAAGLLFALTLGNPIQNKSRKASKLLLQWSVVGLGFGMNLPAVWSAGVRTLWPNWQTAYNGITHAAKLGLTLTLFLIGAGLSKDAIKTVGVRPLVQGVILWMVVATAGLTAVHFLSL